MLKIDSVHDMSEYMSLLSSSKTIYIDGRRLDRAVKDACYTADEFKELTGLELRIESDGSYCSVSPQSILSFLEDIGVDLEKRYRNRKTRGYSLDIKKVVDPLINDGIQVEMLTYYKTYRSYSTYASFLTKLSETQHETVHTRDGRSIFCFDTQIQERENLRVYYSDIAVVSIPKKYSNIIMAKSEDYHLAWCDYPQADWRFAYNLFIQDPSNVDIMRSCEDAYEGLARIIEGDNFNSEEFKETRKQYKVSCLSSFYNSQDKREIPTEMRKYFMSREKYRRYFQDLKLLQKFKLPVPITSYFGFEQLLPEASYPDAFISKGLNTPIQTFTSHIVNETVMGILDKFWSLGYTKDDINIYFVRHDEPIFMFKDSIIKDAWVFKDCSQIHVDGFTPIKLDFHFGDYYQEEDEYLSKEIHRQMSSYGDMIQNYAPGTIKDYYPVPRVTSVYAEYLAIVKDGVLESIDMSYFDYKAEKKIVFHADATDSREALYATLPQIIEYLGFPKYLLVYNSNITVDLDVIETGEGDGTIIKVIDQYDLRVTQFTEREEVKVAKK